MHDEAFRSIDLLEISEENYKVAWDIFEKRIKNTRLIVYDHIVALIKAPTISKQSHTALRKLLHT